MQFALSLFEPQIFEKSLILGEYSEKIPPSYTIRRRESFRVTTSLHPFLTERTSASADQHSSAVKGGPIAACCTNVQVGALLRSHLRLPSIRSSQRRTAAYLKLLGPYGTSL